jgi:hypothetical protein
MSNEQEKVIMAKKKSIHYVNNAEFSAAVHEYVNLADEAKVAGKELPIIPNYVAQCFLKIAEGLSHKYNFVSYTYREEMVMDAVENCLRAIKNYNLEAATRTGKPNAFSYFTKISWYAFLRRIKKEKKEQDIKTKYISESGIENFITGEDMKESVVAIFVDSLRERISSVKERDNEFIEYKKKEKEKTKRKPRVKAVDSDLVEFINE